MSSREVTAQMVRGGFYECTPVLRDMRLRLHNEGYGFISERKHNANESCGCRSRRKFKNCCESNVVRRAGAIWFKPDATQETRRML